MPDAAPSATTDSAPPAKSPPRAEPRWRLPLLLGLLAVLMVVAGVYWYRSQPKQCFARALAALDAEEWDLVEREFLVLERSPRFEPEIHLLKGALLLKNGRPDVALREFALSQEREELQVRALTLAGQAMYQIGNLRMAEQLLTQAVAADGENFDAYRALGVLYYDLGANDQAMLALTRAAELWPEDPGPSRLMGLMNKDYERFDKAVEHYREALRRIDAGPRSNKLGLNGRPKPLQVQPAFLESLLLELAESEAKQREYAAALTTLDRCAPSPEQEVLRAECFHSLGKTKDAQSALERALAAAQPTAGPTAAFLDALTWQGTLALEADDAAAAVKSLQQAVDLFPKDYKARFKLAQAYRKQGNSAQADKHGRAADALKKLREDFAELHKVAIQRPTDAGVRFRLGLMAEELNKPEMAAVWYKATLALDPTHAGALKKLQP